MQLRWILLTSSLIASLGFAASAHAAPSFDCAKATTAIEKSICQSSDLSALDAELAATLNNALNRAGADRDGFVRQQRAWLAQRDTCEPVGERGLACLRKSYADRIRVLQLYKNPVADANKRICRAFADRVEALDPTKVDLDDILKNDANLQLLPRDDGYEKVEDLLDALAKTIAPATIPTDTKTAIEQLAEGYGASFAHLPQTDLYLVGTVQGSMSCVYESWFEIRDGQLRPALSTPMGEYEACGRDIDRVGRFDGKSIRLTHDWTFTPSFVSSVTMSAYADGVWAPSCSVSLDFARTYKTQPEASDNAVCTAADCTALNAEAQRVAEAYETGHSLSQKPLPTDARATYRAMAEQWRKDHPRQARDPGDVFPASSESFTDADPDIVPDLFDGKLYLVTFGHRTIGWRTFSDWEVGFWIKDGDGLKNVLMTTVVVGRGKLLSVNIAEPIP